ncbi:MAG: FAD-dependent oxidoreductase [Ignavibacteria bacterium]|nr:FAD-dependent oxidoreductase [Ignavibacteria bacterium]MBK6419545.1 FAD-dependent oxidoreductase [Ignavibacteria bacterium]MBK7184714.1 FAD-dependent oxidoreductase [Ignavibacteria bacterium]MBK7577018.1 FAD-dependent oxidoreductase [Ignavibacteria bacterium]MBK9182915.1 FAD-dependent oxidoreductase [Ignavibacteria bacterium]
MSRTPLMRLLRRAINAAQHDASRRDFIRTSAMAGAALALPSFLSGCGKPSELKVDRTVKVAVVGAGLAGLHAAWLLHNKGVNVDVYEASKRVGGRVMTSHDLLVNGTWTELGGEFIDSGHGDMLTLASQFGVELIDTETTRLGEDDTFYFFGQHFTMQDIVTEISPYLDRIREDQGRMPPSMTDLKNSPASALDAMSLDTYLASIGVGGWLRSFLEVAFVTENGLELGEQSALNFIMMVSPDVADGSFHTFGASDERFVAKGGVQQITDRLADPLRTSIHTGHKLTRIERSGTRFVLTFRKDTTNYDVLADHVVLAIPFTMLRDVEMDVDLPEIKKRAINELRYGSNGKILMGFEEPFWQADGNSGSILTDLPLQLVWDNTYLQQVKGAGLTMYYGGSMSRVIGSMSIEQVGTMMMEHLATVWPSFANVTRGRTERMHWPSYPYVKASYSAYGPGQWTLFYGTEGESVGNLHFAGEHCSLQHKGYMNGAAETGRYAAEKILAAMA